MTERFRSSEFRELAEVNPTRCRSKRPCPSLLLCRVSRIKAQPMHSLPSCWFLLGQHMNLKLLCRSQTVSELKQPQARAKLKPWSEPFYRASQRPPGRQKFKYYPTKCLSLHNENKRHAVDREMCETPTVMLHCLVFCLHTVGTCQQGASCDGLPHLIA